MSQEPQQIERDDATSIYDADPILGKYVSHHPSNRIRLLIIGAILYAIPVGILQLLFWNVDDQTAAIFLPFLFAGLAGAVLWYMLHHWNREVVLYERGFSYRQGSTTAYILYANIVKLKQHIENVSLLFFSRMVYDYTLITDIDETIRINNLYSNPEKLTRLLDALIINNRLPTLHYKIDNGETVKFGESLGIMRDGIVLNERELFWHEYKTQRVREGQLILQSKEDDEWAVVPVNEIDNPALLIALLKSGGKRKAVEDSPL